MFARFSIFAAVLAVAVPAHADDDEHAAQCLAALDSRHISYVRGSKPGIAIGVEVTGPLGGVTYKNSDTGALVIDCSLVVSLADAGPYLTALGITTATYISAYSRRNVRGTNRPSKHSYGLAMDVAGFSGDTVGSLRVARDFEQGLGDGRDCIGQPLTEGGALLKIAQCQLSLSGLFYLVLSPDYDDAHHDHFHLEAKPWRERPTVRSTSAAIH